MRFKLDENLPVEIVVDLHASGHEADSVHDEGLDGASDPLVLDRARDEGRVLLTLDKGIGDLRAYNPGQYRGIVLFRPPASGRATTLAFVRQHLSRVLSSELDGRLVVVTGTGLRFR
jgi:predicted nuclease of predicted toxin-antitoxin system